MTETIIVSMTPDWPAISDQIVLDLVAYTTSGFTYSAQITGPSLNNKIDTGELSGADIFFSGSGNKIQGYQQGDTLTFNVEITCNTEFDAIEVNNMRIGLKPVDQAITYQSIIFCNDSGSDNDWNDLVVTLSLYSQSGD